MRECPDDGRKHPPLEVAGDVGDRLTAPEGDLRRQLDDVPAKLVNGDLEG